MLFEIIMYVVLAIIAGDNIYQIWKLTRSGKSDQFKPGKTLGYLIFTLVIVIIVGLSAPWGTQISIVMWWIIAATTAAYAGVAIWRILRNRELEVSGVAF